MEYDVGFDGDGKITALAIRGWFLTGADVDLAFIDQVTLRDKADTVRRHCYA